MRTTILPLLLVCGACVSAPPTATEVFVESIDRVTEVSVYTRTLGVAPPACGEGSQRFDFVRNTLTITACQSSRTVTASPADGAALRAALRAVEIQSIPCRGYDGDLTSVSFTFEPGVAPTGFALGLTSCPGGGEGTEGIATIDASSWAAARAVLGRISVGG